MQLEENSSRILILESAIQMEKDGIEYYTKAARDIDNPMGEQMFLSLAEDEKRHLKIFEDALNNTDNDNAGIENIESLQGKIKTIFSDKSGTYDTSSRQKEIIEHAIQMEEKGINFYTENCARLGGKSSETCEFIIKEEKQHRKILENTLEYLQDNISWNIETEGWSFDG